MNRQFWHRNGSTILTCIGGAGVVATAITTSKATLKVSKVLEEAEKEKKEELTKMEKVKKAAPYFVVPAIIGIGTVASIFGANHLSQKQQASLASAYALLDQSYKKYKHKLKELYGEETHQEIINAIAIEDAKDVYIHSECMCNSCDLSAEEHSSEPVTFYDEYANRYFTATIEQVITAEYHLNRNYVLRGYSVLNEFYEFLGLEPTDYGSEIGWAINDDGTFWIDFNHRKVQMPDGMECYIIEMPFGPDLEWKEYY